MLFTPYLYQLNIQKLQFILSLCMTSKDQNRLIGVHCNKLDNRIQIMGDQDVFKFGLKFFYVIPNKPNN